MSAPPPLRHTTELDEHQLPPERDDGGTEYKLLLSAAPDSHRHCKLTTQLVYRLGEGGGQCVYWLGVHDDGRRLGLSPGQLRRALAVLRSLAEAAGARITEVRQIPTAAPLGIPGVPPLHADLLRKLEPDARRRLCARVALARTAGGRQRWDGTLAFDDSLGGYVSL